MQISNLKQLLDGKRFEVFNCGSQRLSHCIRTQLNMAPIQVYKHNKTGKIINVFIMTKELSKFLENWSSNKPERREY